MVGLFTFDGPMYRDCNGVYCNTTITNEMLDRYFTVVDKLFVLIRTIPRSDTYENLHLKKLEINQNLEIVEIPNLNTPYGFISRFRYMKTIQDFVCQSDLIFLRIPSIISNMAATICDKLGKPYLVEVGGCAWDSYFNHGLLGKLIAPLMYYQEKATVAKAHFASYVTNLWLQHRYPTSGKSISASNVYLSDFNQCNIQRRISRYKHSKPERYRLGTIASVDVRYKGQEYIIRALGALKKKGIILDYDLVGAGDSTFLRKLANKCGVSAQVHFLGVKLHEDIWDWLDSIDIYAQPSKQEGLPRAIIEAFSRGCLVIGSDVAGIPELVEQDLIFKSGNIEQICNVILRVIHEADHTKRIVHNFKKSKEFDVCQLNERRNLLFEGYRQYVLRCRKNNVSSNV